MPRHQVQDIEGIMAIIVSSIDYTLWRDRWWRSRGRPPSPPSRARMMTSYTRLTQGSLYVVVRLEINPNIIVSASLCIAGPLTWPHFPVWSQVPHRPRLGLANIAFQA